MAKNNNLSQGLSSYLQGMNEEQAVRTLNQEGRRLKYIALKVWRKYLSSYQPKKYAEHLTGTAGSRTRNTQRGIKLGRVKRLDGNTFGIELTFENSLMYHDSVFGSSHKKGHSLMLISDGWHSKKLEKRIGRVYMFTYFEGVDIIGQIEKEYNRGKPLGITLETQWSGEYLK